MSVKVTLALGTVSLGKIHNNTVSSIKFCHHLKTVSQK